MGAIWLGLERLAGIASVVHLVGGSKIACSEGVSLWGAACPVASVRGAPMPISREQFITLLTNSHKRIYNFIGSMVIDRNDADDIMQETSLALWKHADEFQEGTDFGAWACSFAYYRVIKLRRAKHYRLKLADRVVERLASDALGEAQLDRMLAAEQFELRRRALVECLQAVPDRNRGLLLDYYANGRSLADIGLGIGRNANAVAQLFHRLRSLLRDCMAKRLPSPPA
jgi:RNA polymerase sigma-70 factor, ECF subfamily